MYYHELRQYVAYILADDLYVSKKTIQNIPEHKSLAATEVYSGARKNDLLEIIWTDVDMIEKTYKSSLQNYVEKYGKSLFLVSLNV